MSLRKLMGLALVLVVLVALYFGSEWMEHREDLGRLQEMRMTAFEPAEVQSIAVQQAGGPEVKAVREDGSWKAVAPSANLIPDQERWNRMAAALAILINRRTLENTPERLEEYGLAAPALRVWAEAGSGGAAQFAFGKLDPIQMNRYAQAGDGTVFLAPKEIFDELNKSPQELRYPFAFRVGAAGITRLAFARIWTGAESAPGGDTPAVGEESVRVELVRDDAESPWRMISPIEDVAAQEPVNALVQELQYLRASGHIDEPEALSDYGLDPPNARVTIQAGDDGEQTLLIGGLDMGGEPEGKLFAKRADLPSVFLIDGHLISLLPARPGAFRDRRLLTGNIGDVNRIDFAWGDQAFTIERGADDGWHITLPQPRDTDQETVSALLAYLKSLEGVTFADGPPESFGLAPAEATITLHYKEGRDPSVIRIGAEAPGGSRYVMQDRGYVLTLPAHPAEALFVPEEHFASKALLRFLPQDVTALELTFEGVHYAFRRSGGQWSITEPAGVVLQNQADVEAILGAINGAEAERAPEGGATGLDSPTAELLLTWESEAAGHVQRRLTIGAPMATDAQRRYAAVDDRSLEYTISQDVITQIRESLRGIAPGATVVN